METIMILADAIQKALVKAGNDPSWRIVRMGIQYNTYDELYHGRVWFAANSDIRNFIRVRDINEDGTIEAVTTTIIE